MFQSSGVSKSLVERTPPLLHVRDKGDGRTVTYDGPGAFETLRCARTDATPANADEGVVAGRSPEMHGTRAKPERGANLDG